MANKFKLFIGPCVLESESLASEIAETLLSDLAPYREQMHLVFKGSFDKANRSSIHAYRGPGIDQGLKILEMIKGRYQLPVVTDFHEAAQAMEVAAVVDYLQVPAFLCRQTDLIVAGASACARYQRTLKIKKGQFLSPYEAKNIITKAEHYLEKQNILMTERGSSFGYQNLIVDMSSFAIIQSFGVQVIHDATHCVQMPGALGDSTGGKREFVGVLAKAAVAAGANGVFVETHPNPPLAKSDAATAYPLGEVKQLVAMLLKIYQVVQQ